MQMADDALSVLDAVGDAQRIDADGRHGRDGVVARLGPHGLGAERGEVDVG